MQCSTDFGGGADAARLVGDPVDTLTGAVFDRKLEFRLTGPLELWWHRYYDSGQARRQSACGWGHSHEFDRYLRFDVDGISSYAPVGRRTGLPALLRDGEVQTRGGLTLTRLSVRRYRLEQPGEPGMEFEFRHPEQRARLARLFKGNHQIVFSYDAANRLTRIVDSAGRALAVVEREDGRVASVSLEATAQAPERLLVGYEYDEQGNLASTVNSSGHGYRFAYDHAGRMIRRIGRKGFEFRYAYDEQGRCVRAEGDERLYGVSLDYQIEGRVTRVTRADGGVWTYFFDEAGALTQILDPLGGMRRYLRDESGRLVAEIDPNGNATRIVYAASGAPSVKIDPLNRRIALPEDPNAPDPSTHRVAAHAAEYEFGRLIDVRGIRLPVAADLRDLPLTAEARRFIIVRPLAEGASPVSPVDAVDAAQFHVRPLGVDWWPPPANGRRFNAMGQLVGQVDEWGRERTWTYDASGNVAEFRDFDGGRWAHDFGRWHFLLEQTDPRGTSARFGYTTQGEVASFTDAGGSRTEYRHDTKDRLIEVWRHGAPRDIYTRDAGGNLIAKHDGAGRELMRLEIGPGNLPVKRTLASGDEQTFSYDAAGRPLVATTNADRVEFAYDAFGNRTADQRNGLGVSRRFELGRKLIESVLFDRFAVLYEHGVDGGVQIIDPGGKAHRIRFLKNGLIERRHANGSSELAQYDHLGRCLAKRCERATGATRGRRYHWSGEGELRLIENGAHGQVRHEYDSAHRLIRRVGGGRADTYEMDLAGNLLRQPGLSGVAMDPGNRLVSANGQTFTYDIRNHIESRNTSRGRVRYEYDGRDQLIEVRGLDGEWRAQYDALGRRTRKSWSGRVVEYYWSSDQLVAEVSANGPLRIYLYADPLALTPILCLDYDSIASPVESCRRYVIFSDQIGTPISLEDDGGKEVWRADIAPFGDADVDDRASIEFNPRFPGHYFDAELGLHYNRFRYYDPVLGRYLQSDPWGLEGGDNVYAYLRNPLSSVDVRGLGEGNGKKGAGAGEGGCDDESDTSSGKTATPPSLDDQFGPATEPWMVRKGEGQYPPEAQVVRPGEPLVLEPGTKYVYIIDPEGNMHVAPEQGSLGRDTKHTDLAQNGPARISGEINPTNDPNLFVMNDDSGRYSWRRDDDGSFQPTRTADQQRNAGDHLRQADLGGNSVVTEPELYGDQFDQLGAGRQR